MLSIDRNRRKAAKLRARAVRLDQRLIDQHKDDDLESVVLNVVGRATYPMTDEGVTFIEYDGVVDAYLVPRFEVERMARELKIQADQAIVNGQRFAALSSDHQRLVGANETLATENELLKGGVTTANLDDATRAALMFRTLSLYGTIKPSTPPSPLRFPENGGS